MKLFDVELPIFQAPMAGAQGSELAAAVCEGGGLGALPCAMLSVADVRREVAAIRARTAKPFVLNFFCHRPPVVDAEREARWRARLAAYYTELGATPLAADAPRPGRAAFDAEACAAVEELRPAAVSFHFGLPDDALVRRVKATGAKVIASATTVEEATWLEARGCDAIIAQGVEAGGHRGCFLSEVASDTTTLALVPMIVDAVRIPVIAAGGIGDARAVRAALALGASAAQIGTAFLFTPEAKISAMHRAALRASTGSDTAVTNVFTGRPARGFANRFVREVGPLAADAPAFPRAVADVAPLRARAEALGSSDFSPMWSGQAAPTSRAFEGMPAAEVTRRLAS